MIKATALYLSILLGISGVTVPSQVMATTEPIEMASAYIIPHEKGDVVEKPISTNKVTEKKVAAFAEQMTQKGDLNKVIGFAQINDLLYYVERGTEVNYITKEAYIDLKTIDKNGTINNLGHLFNLVERHPDDTTIGYVELLRVGDKLLLVTHARIFNYDFETGKFMFLDRQADVDTWEEPWKDATLRAKWNKMLKEGYLADVNEKNLGFISRAFHSENKLYLKLDVVCPLSTTTEHLNNVFIVVDVNNPKDRYMMGRQLIELYTVDNITIDENDNLFVYDSLDTLRTFSQDEYYKNFYWQNYHYDTFNRDWDVNPSRQNTEEVLIPSIQDIKYHLPLFINDKLIAQTKRGLVYFDTANGLADFDMETLNGKVNQTHYWLIQDEDMFFGYDEFNYDSLDIIWWCVGQDGNVYALANAATGRIALSYLRFIKITPPSEWNTKEV